MLLYVSGSTGLLASGVFAAFVLSLKRFHSAQQLQLESSASLDRAIDALDTAYFTLRQSQRDAPDASGVGRASYAEPSQRLPITREALHAALQDCAAREGDAPISKSTVDDLWAMLDANGDGVLTADELRLGEPLAARARGGAATSARTGSRSDAVRVEQ